MFKIVHETYSLILCFALANAFKPLTVFWLNQDAENIKKSKLQVLNLQLFLLLYI